MRTTDKDNTIVYCYMFYERDGKLEIPHHFGMSSRFPNPKDDGGELIDLVRMIVNTPGLAFERSRQAVAAEGRGGLCHSRRTCLWTNSSPH